MYSCGPLQNKLISDVLLYADMGCSPEDLPEAMDDREGWQERVKDIHADSAT